MKLTSPNRAIAEGTTRKLFSTPTTSHAPVLMPTCSKVFKQSSNSEAAGSVAAYLAMRERQKQNVAAPRMENGTDQLDGQEGIAEEVDAGKIFLCLCTALFCIIEALKLVSFLHFWVLI